jgi:hypothetical protein
MLTAKNARGNLFVLAIGLALASSSPLPRQSIAGTEQATSEHSIRLIVDYGDGVQKHFTALPWKKDMTVFDAMSAAKESTHGITFQHTGSGATAFLTKIDDMQNEGGAGKRNWIFWVNTSLGDKSFGVYKLDPSDVVSWRFTSHAMKR